MKLQARILILLIPLVCGSLAFVGQFAYSNLRETALARASEQVQFQLSQLQLALDAKRSGVSANMDLFAAAPLLRDFIGGSEFERTNIYQRPLSRLFMTYQDAYPEYAEMGVLGPSGDLLAGVFSVTVSEDMRGHFPTRLGETRTQFIGVPAVDVPSLLVVRKVAADDKERFGYLVVLLDLAFLKPMLSASGAAKGISFVVTDMQGSALYASSADAMPSLAGTAMEADDVMLATSDTPIRMTSRQVFDTLRLVALVSEKSLTAGADVLATRVLQIIAFATLMTVALVYVGMRVMVISRLHNLKEAVEHIAEGRMDVPVSMDGKDEIASLGSSFEDMRRRLLESQQRISEQNRTLEQKVRERTQELVDTQQQLVLKEKLASTSVLTAGIAHEINNPVNFIHGGAQNIESMLKEFQDFMLELLEEDADPELSGEFARRFLSMHQQLRLVMEGSGRIRDIVQNLRVITHLDQNELTAVDIMDGLEKSLEIVNVRQGGAIVFECHADTRPRVSGYGAEINQLFMNLLVNACQAITDRQATGDPAPGFVRVNAHEIDSRLRITIADNGCGMAPEVMGRAFDPFFTTREVGSGTGLGLSIAQAIIHKHDGVISLQSTPGKGTVVTLDLPVIG